jgi:uncharacterized membrane protein YdjX (TVP38/TMEM64 family)
MPEPSDSATVLVDGPAPVGAWQNSKVMIKRLGPAGPLALLAATFPLVGGFVLIGFISRLAPWLRSHAVAGLWIYVCGFAALTALAILPTYACAILGGWTFGMAVGFPASMGAFGGGALLAYLINASAAGDRVVKIVQEHPKWEAVRVALLGSGFWKTFWIITLLRLPPYSPFAATNFVLATTRARLDAYLLATLVGMAPRTFAAVWAAAHASTLEFKDSKGVWSFVVGLAITIVIVGIIGRMANQAIQRATGQPR